MTQSPVTAVLAEVLADPARVAVIVVDMQNDFCTSDGALATAGADTSVNRAIIPPLEAFTSDLRERGGLIVWSRQVRSELMTSPAMRRRLRTSDRHADLCTSEHGTAIVGGLHPRPEDLIVNKYRYSVFHGTDLEVALRSRGITTIIVTGTAVNACVDATCRDAQQSDFDVIVPRDLVGHTDSRLAEAALVNLGRYFAYVSSADEIRALIP